MNFNVAELRKLNLAEIKKRLRPSSAVAITLESGRLVVNFVAREEEGGKVSQTLSIPAGAEEVFREPDKAGAQLASALQAAGIRQKRCVVCLPPGWALTTSTELPEITGEDLQSFLELRAEREFPVAITELKLAHCPYSMPDGARRATLVAIPSKRIEAVDKMLAAAGCKAVSTSLALGECVADPKPALHFLANGTHTDVVITAGGGVVSMRSLDGPGPSDETPFDPALFFREVRITLGRLPDSIRQQVRVAKFGGAAASIQRLCDTAGEPLRKLGIESPDCVPGAAPKLAGIDPAVKAAQAFLRQEPVPFEFFMPEVNRFQETAMRYNTPIYRKVGGIAACVIVLPVLVFWARGRWADHLESKWNAMSAKAGELDALQQKIHKYRPWFPPGPEVLKTFENLIGAFPEQGDVWAKSIQFQEGNKVVCTGFARNQEAALALMKRLSSRPDVSAVQGQQFRGDNPVQFSFTFKWQPGS